MKNLKSIIHYECATSFKYIWLFYAIQYALVGFITMIVGLVMGTFEEVGTNCLEMNSLVYVSILGVLVDTAWIYPKIHFYSDIFHVLLYRRHNGTCRHGGGKYDSLF